jgi:hypothetical protein
MIDIGPGAVQNEQIDEGRLRHAFQPLLMARMQYFP